MTDKDKPAFAQAMARLCIALREKDPDSAQMRIYFDALRPIELETVMAAADRITFDAKFFPKPSEWREAANAIQSERASLIDATIMRRKLRGDPPLCLACDDTGFVVTAETNTARRCDCRELRRREIDGRRPLPELPPASIGPAVTTSSVDTDLRVAAKMLATVKGIS